MVLSNQYILFRESKTQRVGYEDDSASVTTNTLVLIPIEEEDAYSESCVSHYESIDYMNHWTTKELCRISGGELRDLAATIAQAIEAAEQQDHEPEGRYPDM